MLEAVLPITGRTIHAYRVMRVYLGLASRMRTLCGHGLKRSTTVRRRCSRYSIRFSPGGSPFPSVGAFVSCLGAVLQAVGSPARLATKGKEVELVAVAVLAVGADGLEVFVWHHGEGRGLGRRGR